MSAMDNDSTFTIDYDCSTRAFKRFDNDISGSLAIEFLDYVFAIYRWRAYETHELIFNTDLD
jgi:hypothetical protein